ncbi:hypothetical protein D3C72_878430 [compost metagenome]
MQAVEEHLPVRKPGQIVVHRILQQPFHRVLLLGNIGDGADAADDFAVGAENRTGADLQPVEMPVFGANAEFVVEAALAMVEQHVERRLEPVAIVRMQARQPVARSAMHGAGFQPQPVGNIGRGDDAVARYIPIPDRITAARQRQRLTLEVGEQALLIGAAGEGVLDDGKADQKHDQHQPAAECGLHDVVVQLPRHRQPAAEQPDEDERPGGNEQDRPVVTVETEIDDERDAGRCGEREGHARDA